MIADFSSETMKVLRQQYYFFKWWDKRVVYPVKIPFRKGEGKIFSDEEKLWIILQ